jgi:hypothetical protein
MMKHVIIDENEISSSVAMFKKRMAAVARSERDMEWAFPSGWKGFISTFFIDTDMGELLVAVPKKWEERQAHLFALNHTGAILTPDAEINIPDGLNRRVSGTYVRDADRVLICHRGGFNAFRGRIPKDICMGYFEKWLVPVNDEGRETSLISVAMLDSKSLTNEIAEFVAAAKEMRAAFRDGAVDIGKAQLSSWRNGDEFEGTKSNGHKGEPSDYDYLHGPLCNALRRQLKVLVHGKRDVSVVSNKHVDVAIVHGEREIAKVIFEVKTSASFTSQLYSAVGQLYYYKHRHGNDLTLL